MNVRPEEFMNLDRVIHEPARMVILTALSSAESAEFRFLESLTGLTAGNLSSHIAKLEAAGYISVEKSFRNKRPLTTLKITRTGRSALKTYRDQLRKALR